MENITIFAKSAPVKATAKLVIKDFVEVMGKSKPGKCYPSDTFMVGDIPMIIEVYPNGATDEEKGNVSVYLWNKSECVVKVECRFVTGKKDRSFEYKMLFHNRPRADIKPVIVVQKIRGKVVKVWIQWDQTCSSGSG